MLHPKLILLTSNWVWNSPVFGAVARMADFYPVANGAENSIELLADRVKQGYSVAIFPEGTRSVDGGIKRFHKGAFYLAEQLNIDILPILIHGTGYTMTKGDFLLKDGRITLKYLPRIKQSSTHLGTGYAEKTKLIGRYFKEEFKQLSIVTERPRYFKEQLIYNYLYKGPIMEWQLKLKLLLEKNYQFFHELMPRKGKMLAIGCGNGYMAYLLHFAAKEREFTGIDLDEDKIELASNCFSKDNNINFIFADALTFGYGHYDAITVAGVLRNMRPANQKRLIEKCINALNPGGMLIIRIKNKNLTQKNSGSIATNLFESTTPDALPDSLSGIVKQAAAAHGMKCETVQKVNYTSDIVFVLKQEQRN